MALRKDPFRGPQWRFERVLELLSGYPDRYRCDREDDQHVRDAREYYLARLKANGADELRRVARKFHGYDVARRVYLDIGHEANLRTMVEARILADQSLHEIAHAAYTDPDVIVLYELLFFDVRDKLDRTDWIVRHVLHSSAMFCYATRQDEEEAEASPVKHLAVLDPEAPAFAQRLHNEKAHEQPPVAMRIADTVLKFAAYYGGPLVCEAMITGLRRSRERMVSDPASISGWVAEAYQNVVAKRAFEGAVNFRMNSFNLEPLMALAAKMQEVEAIVRKSGGAGSSKSTQAMAEAVQTALSQIEMGFGDTPRVKFLYDGSQVDAYDRRHSELRAGALEAVAMLDSDAVIDTEYDESAFQAAAARRKP